jgi:hypothetical protein
LSKYWKIPPDGDATFVAAMEDVLNVYRLPYDPRFPVVCMDESSKQLVGEVHAPIAAKPGQVAIADHEYVRHGVAMLFVEVEPLAGHRHVEVTERRTRQDWARFVKGMLEQRYPEAIKVRLVMDNLNTHTIASLYETFPPAEARALADRLHIHYTPKHGSWLNIAGIELSALNGQCLHRRIPDIEARRRQTKPPQQPRRSHQLALHHRRCPHQTAQTLSEVVAVT